MAARRSAVGCGLPGRAGVGDQVLLGPGGGEQDVAGAGAELHQHLALDGLPGDPADAPLGLGLVADEVAGLEHHGFSVPPRCCGVVWLQQRQLLQRFEMSP